MPKKAGKKTTRGPRGMGSVFPDKRRGGWIARAANRDEFHGATQAEAIANRAAAEPPGPTTTVSEWCDKWLATVDVRPQTLDNYRASVKLRIKPQLGTLVLTKVTAFDVEGAVKEWRQKVSINTALKYVTHLKALFSAAGRADLMARNPAKLAKTPTATKVKIDPFTVAELAAIVRSALGHPTRRIVAVLATTGCRLGEALGLEPITDYNRATGELTISRTATRRHGPGPPKSVHSTRTIRVPPGGRAALEAGIGRCGFTGADARWREILAELELRYRNPHQLRHSVATHAIAAGVPIANVARDLGDTVDTIVKTYCHPTPGADVCSAMERLLGGAEVAPSSGSPLETL